MKLTNKERQAITLLRKLDIKQRDKLLEDIQRHVLANTITLRVGKLRRLKIVDDRTIENAFGSVPTPKKRHLPRRRGNTDPTT